LPSFKIIQQLSTVLVAQFRIALHALGNNVREGRRNALIMLRNGNRTLLRTLNQTGESAVGSEWHLAGEQLVENQSEREQVGALIQLATERLFGRHVLHRSHERAGLGHAV